MNAYFLIAESLICYCLAVLCYCLRLPRIMKNWLVPWLVLSLLALLGHGWLLYRAIDVMGMQNLALVNMLSCILWLMGCVVVLTAWRPSMPALSLLIFPAACAAIVAMLVWPGQALVATKSDPLQLGHILLSLLTFSIFALSALQAILIFLQNYLLKHNYASHWLGMLPSLEASERWLFQLINLGFVCLTLTVIFSLTLFGHFEKSYLYSKAMLSLVIWLVFAGLLLGHYFFGWRGMLAQKLTWFGVAMLMLLYFGSLLLRMKG